MRTLRRSLWHFTDSVKEFWCRESDFICEFIYCMCLALALLCLFIAYGCAPLPGRAHRSRSIQVAFR